MRSSHTRLYLLLATSLCAFGLWGCGSDSSSEDSPQETDGAAEPTDGGKESSTADAPSTPDASPDAPFAPDSSTDAPSTDASPGPDAQAHDSAPDAPWSPPDRDICANGYASPETAGLIDDAELSEASGIVASWRDPLLLWSHNDSGDTARLFAMTTSGHVRGRVHLKDVQAVDWEDIAAASCPDGSGPCLWIADTGNNGTTRDELAIYVIPEPDLAGMADFGDIEVTVPWTIRFHYPEAPIDSEALVVMPDASAFYLFEKVDAARGSVYRYQAPFDTTQAATLEKAAEFGLPGVPVSKGRMITGADMHPSESRLLLRVYTGTFEYQFGSGQGIEDIDSLLAQLVALGPLDEPQGEAVAYDWNGNGLWTISEVINGSQTRPLHHYACKPASGSSIAP